MAARKPRIEYYWTPVHSGGFLYGHDVNWRLIGANGEIMCHSTQGFRDKADARRAVDAVVFAFCGWDGVTELVRLGHLREVGPGRKPQ